MTIAVIGAASNIFSKSSKYALFDTCKEIVYIPLSSHEQKIGKSTVDIIANPLGKSGGSFIQQALILANGSILESSTYIFILLVLSLGYWIYSICDLDKYISQT